MLSGILSILTSKPKECPATSSLLLQEPPLKAPPSSGFFLWFHSKKMLSSLSRNMLSFFSIQLPSNSLTAEPAQRAPAAAREPSLIPPAPLFLPPKNPLTLWFFLSLKLSALFFFLVLSLVFLTQLRSPKKNHKKSPVPRGGLQICPSSVEFTSARNMNTGMKRKCE